MDNANVGKPQIHQGEVAYNGVLTFLFGGKFMYKKVLDAVKKQPPLVHNITNYVTVNDCANIILAANGSPIMSDDESEVSDITSLCNSLVINIGTLNKNTIPSMLIAAKKANQLNHPVILDPVGVGASTLRNNTCKSLLAEIQFAVIRGNISEMKALFLNSNSTNGVDANEMDAITENNLPQAIDFAKKCSKQTGAIICISGAIDIVTDDTTAYVIKNGHPIMSKITGTGCMSSAVIGCYVANKGINILDATACAVVQMGISGEKAYKKMIDEQTGLSSYRTYLIDFFSKLNEDDLKAGEKIEIY